MSKTKTKKPVAKRDVIDVTESGTPSMDRHEVQDWFDRWADQFATRLPDVFGNRLPEFWGASREMGGVMRIEEIIDDDGLLIRGEIPGIDPDDIEITVDNGRLNVKAERRQSETEAAGEQFRTEFRYGSYRRSCTLPAGAATEDIVATYNDGILEIRVPVDSEASQAARISVSKTG